MNGVQKILCVLVLIGMYSSGMERPPTPRDKNKIQKLQEYPTSLNSTIDNLLAPSDNLGGQKAQMPVIQNSFIGLLPSGLTHSLAPLFSTPGPAQRSVSTMGEFRARDNSADPIIESAKNMRRFQQFCQEVYGSRPANEVIFLEAQIAFLEAHPEEKSFYLPNSISAAAALGTSNVWDILDQIITQKIELFKQLPQDKKNKTALDCMRHFPTIQIKAKLLDEKSGTATASMRPSCPSKIMSKLLDAGAEVDACDSDTGFTLVRHAVEAKSPELLDLFLRRKAAPDKPDRLLTSPLMRTAILGEKELAALLLQYNCSVNLTDAKGRTALGFAARKGDNEMIDILQANRAYIFAGDSEKKNPLVQAVKSGSPSTLRKLIDTCKPQDAHFSGTFEVFINLALKKAAKKGYEVMVNELLPNDHSVKLDLKRSMSPDKVLDSSKPNETALSLAIKWGHPSIALKLLDYARDRYYKGMAHILYARSHALALAVQKKVKDPENAALYQKVIDTLLEENIAPMYPSDRRKNIKQGPATNSCSSAAFLAASYGDGPLLKKFIDHVALHKYLERNAEENTEKVDLIELAKLEKYYANKLLVDAMQSGMPTAIRTLYDYGAEVGLADAHENTGLHKAVIVADNNTIEEISKLCAYYQSDTINRVNKEGNTPLHCALKNPDIKIKKKLVKILIKHGADVCATNKAGDTPLIIAAGNDSPLLVVIDVLLEALSYNKDKINQQNNKGRTALFCAAAKGRSHIEVVEKIVAAKANANIKNDSGCGPLSKAARHGLAEMTKIIVEGGGDLELFKEGMLREAAKGGHVEYIKILMKKKPDLNGHSSSDGDTALHKAVKRQQIEAVKFLLAEGADKSVKNFKGRTPLECAIALGYDKIAKLVG